MKAIHNIYQYYQQTHLCDCMSSNIDWQANVNGSFASNVRRSDFLNDIATNDVIYFVLGKSSLCEEALNGQTLKVDSQLVFVDARGHGKGESDTSDNDHIFEVRPR